MTGWLLFCLKYFYLIYIICTVISFHTFPSITNNVLLFLKNFFAEGPIEYEQFLKRSIKAIDGTLTGTTTPGQSRSGNNGNEGLLYILQIFRTRA